MSIVDLGTLPMTAPNHPWPELTSAIDGIVWPPMLRPNAALLLSLSNQLESSQWLNMDVLAERQRMQLHALLQHTAEHAPYVRECLAQAALTPDTASAPGGLQRFPVLTRQVLQGAGSRLFTSTLPPTHLPLSENRTSGSCGVPVVVRRTAISQLFWHAFILREHRWHQRDFSLPLAIIRANAAKVASPVRNNWGPPVSLLWASGPSAALPIATDIGAQAQWLHRFNPGYLLTYPSNLAALIEELKQRAIPLPRLRQIRTIGETLQPHIREQVRAALDVEIVDTYSSQEVGIIAIQCPYSGLYHTMAENLVVEVLRDDDTACAIGETGRVVVTDLSNLATSLLRYDIGDYAEVGSKCPCGRGLPTLSHISGRQRNMVRLPDGRRHWPLVGFQRYREIAPIRQYQLIQRSIDHIEVRFVVERPLSEEEQRRLGKVICDALGYAFQLTFVYFEGEIPKGKNGKFEEFVSGIV